MGVVKGWVRVHVRERKGEGERQRLTRNPERTGSTQIKPS
jgi:hypothetical protein